jgi:peptide chain release factor 2
MDDDLLKNANNLKEQVSSSIDKLKINDSKVNLQELQELSLKPDFWQKPDQAQKTMKRIAEIESQIRPWLNLDKSLDELIQLTELNDDEMRQELVSQLDKFTKDFDELKQDLKLNGTYDGHGAILSIHAGAGGTDAQDWTQMLFRMYTRFIDKAGWSSTVVDESPGEEAGIKSITIEVDGNFAYGKLKGEQGVHRLVRLSPFNADNLRQTSFAKVEITPKLDEPGDLEIDEKDLKIDVYRSGGHGGQSVNTTDSAVRITHIPTGISVAIQNERSQLQNRETAMTILRSKLAQLQHEQHAERLNDLKGPNQSAEWGNQIRSYVLHPYKQVKDLRTRHESSDPDDVLAGNLEQFIDAYLNYSLETNL